MPADEALVVLAANWPGQPWAWDDRFLAFASTFGAAVEEKAGAAIQLALPQQWTSANVAQAPETYRQICAGSGGLHAGQRLYGGAAFDGVTPFALWWPWGGGQTITLRLGFSGADAATVARLRKVFKVAG